MSLTTLPNEVVVDVIREIDHKEDLLSLISCCRLLQELGEPFLYSSFTRPSRTGAAAFARRLLEKPSLRQYVKEFRWSFLLYTLNNDPLPEVHSHIFTPENRVQVFQVIADSTLSQEEEQRLVQHLYQHRNSDAFIALLLLLLPNLESIELADACALKYLQTFLARLPAFQPSPDAPARHHFANLSNLSILNYDVCQRSCLRDVMHLLNLKTIKDFTIYSPYEWETDPEKRRQIFSCPNSIQDLTLKGDTIGSEELGDFLRCFKNLRRLEYSDDLISVTCCTFDFQGKVVYDAILSMKSQLEVLVLHKVPPTAGGWKIIAEPDVQDDSDGIGPLTDFEKLTHLDITSHVFLGPRFFGNAERPGVHYSENMLRSVANLPSSLEYLVIRDCEEDIHVALEPLLSSTALIESLTTVVVCFLSKECPKETSEPWLSLRKEFRNKTCRLFLLGKYQHVWDAENQEYISGDY